MSRLNPLVVVGSVALDTVETTHGKHRDALGGAAVYFSLASRFFARPRMIGVIGNDFPATHVNLIRRHGVDLEGLQRADGPSFRWAGRYSSDGNVAHTLDTQLGVFARFQPKVPLSYQSGSVLFLANIDPDLQVHVLKQMPHALSGGDTMNFWIDQKRSALGKMLRRLHILFVNDQEARSLTGEHNLIRAARALLKLGPKAAIVKKGEHGSMICTREGILFCPPFPVDTVCDPTGAGDSFAGAFMGVLAQSNHSGRAIPMPLLAKACAYGSVVASFTVGEFGVKGLLAMRWCKIQKRLEMLRRLTQFGNGSRT